MRLSVDELKQLVTRIARESQHEASIYYAVDSSPVAYYQGREDIDWSTERLISAKWFPGGMPSLPNGKPFPTYHPQHNSGDQRHSLVTYSGEHGCLMVCTNEGTDLAGLGKKLMGNKTRRYMLFVGHTSGRVSEFIIRHGYEIETLPGEDTAVARAIELIDEFVTSFYNPMRPTP